MGDLKLFKIKNGVKELVGTSVAILWARIMAEE